MRVETVRGAMVVDGPGTTLTHEHVFVLTRARSWTGRS
jgi:predicted metal-dependent phosphotriesterase family hydrolase